MTRVKICGIRQLEHALAAAEAGADYIGLVFVPGRRRRVDIAAAREIVNRVRVPGINAPGVNAPEVNTSGVIAPGVNAPGNIVPAGDLPKMVGLFADQPCDEVNRIVRSCGLDLVQLCGQESPDYCRRVEAGVIKVLHVPGPGFEDEASLLANIRQFREAGNLVTLDRQVDGWPGGTGQSFDWDLAARLSQQGQEFLLAGGLTPDNVAEAVIRVGPWGVDVSSGVETGGAQDPDKIRAFVKNARRTGG
jgi:phosphoribosylanthranilate isomerase